MFRFWGKRKEYGLVALAIGIGIMLGIILPPIGWMLGCALALVLYGIYCLRNC